jgi:hypothetical protein
LPPSGGVRTLLCMALSFANATKDLRPAHVIGDLKVKFVKVTFDSSYPTGGEAITAADFGLNVIVFVAVNAAANATKVVYWDEANSKLLISTDAGTPAEAANASDQSTVTVQLAVFGY